MPPTGAACDPEVIRSQVSRIVSSKDFDASDRNCRFLEYVVEETLQGRAERIKAYSIATTVFGRGENFDPQQDAIVRIEAGRLRRALEHYYLTSGLNDDLRISIPTGSYVPVIVQAQGCPAGSEATGAEAEPPRPALATVCKPRIRVDAFLTEGRADGLAELAQGFTRHILVGLARFTDLVVVGSECPDDPAGASDAEMTRPGHGTTFVLSGAVAVSGGKLVVEALLRETQSGQYVWSDCFERDFDPASAVATRIDIADRIVRALAQPAGVIFGYLGQGASTAGSEEPEFFESVVRFHQYWQTFDRAQFDSVRLGLERTIEHAPHYAEAFACLSQLYANSVRFGYPGGTSTIHPLRRAIALALRAVQLSPRSSRGYLALGIAYWFNGQIKSAFDALETSVELNPNDMDVLAELGLRHAACARWDVGIPMIEDAYRRNPALTGSYRIGQAIWHYVHGRYQDALSFASLINAPDVIYPYIVVAASAHRLGRDREAKVALGTLLRIAPDYGDRIVGDLQNRNIHPDTINALVSGLREAGLRGGHMSGVPASPVPVSI